LQHLLGALSFKADTDPADLSRVDLTDWCERFHAWPPFDLPFSGNKKPTAGGSGLGSNPSFSEELLILCYETDPPCPLPPVGR
jgi:hypothetical protein